MNIKDSKYNDKIEVKETMKNFIKKLLPRFQFKNPIMFMVYIGSIVLTVMFMLSIYSRVEKKIDSLLFLVMVCLWMFVICANLLDISSEDTNKPKAKALKNVKSNSKCRKLRSFCDNDGYITNVSDLKRGDIVLVKAGEKIPSDGQVIEGCAEVDESEISGENSIVTKSFNLDSSYLTGGSKVISGEIIMKVTVEKGESFLDEMINDIETSSRKKVNPRIVLESLLMILTSIFVFMSIIFYLVDGFPIKIAAEDGAISVLVISVLLFSLCPIIGGTLTTITEKLSINKLNEGKIKVNCINTIEAVAKVNVAFINKAEIVNKEKRRVKEFITIGDIYLDELINVVALSVYKDETIEGNIIRNTILKDYGVEIDSKSICDVIPFTQNTSISGVNLKGREIRKGSPWAIKEYLQNNKGCYQEECNKVVREISKVGNTPIVVCSNEKVLGVIVIEDEIRKEAKDYIKRLKEMKIKPVFVCGGSSSTTLAIAKKIGVDSFLAQATLERKMKLISKYQKDGYTVLVTGCKNIDAPSLAKADIGISTENATEAAKEACNLQITSLKDISIAEVIERCKRVVKVKKRIQYVSAIIEVIKYLAIIPILFSGIFPELKNFLIINVRSVENTIVVLVIYNTISLIILVPLAYKLMRSRNKKRVDMLKKKGLIS